MTAAHVVPVHPVEVETGLWGWSCSCGKASVCTSLEDAAWVLHLHKVTHLPTLSDVVAGVAS